MNTNWMIYGANGYTGELIAREACARGLKPILAGRSREKIEALGRELGLPTRVFDLADRTQLIAELETVGLVLHCAGPFSATSAPMLEACLAAHAHYLDITGEIAVFEHAHAQGSRARAAGIVVCPGVGFDVVPTDCVAAALAQALPDANRLALGFDSKSGLSPGTAKTSVEGLGQGGKIRENGRIRRVPLAYKTRRIDFGAGEKLAMTIPWGDVATAFYSTGIPNIETYIPASPGLVKRLRRLNVIRPLLGLGLVQNLLKKKIEKSVRGPDEKTREKANTFVWGEATNAAGETRCARVEVPNGYSLTVTASLGIVAFLLNNPVAGGAITPSKLMGADYVSRLPGAGKIIVS